jgi:hypothetical protein
MLQVDRLSEGEPSFATRLRPASETWQRSGEGFTSPGWRSSAIGPYDDVGAILPDRLDDDLTVGIGQSDRVQMRWRLEGASGAHAVDHEGRLAYRDALRDTDVVFVATRQRLEAFFLLRSPASPQELVFRVRLAPGLKAARSAAEGGLEFVDPRDQPRFIVPPAVAVDARGQRRPATIEIRGDRIVCRLDQRGLAYPILLDPAVETPTWRQIAGPPQGRYDGGVAYDSARNRLIVFGGTVGYYSTPAPGDTWEWDGNLWRLRASSGPTPRTETQLVYDPDRARTVLFGGQPDNNNYFNDTWEWDGDTWFERIPLDAPPPPRGSYAAAYDPGRRRTVIFGGIAGIATYMSDVWEWDGQRWTQRPTDGSYARYSAAMVYDTARGKLQVYGGTTPTGGNSAQMWEWDGSWVQRTFTGGPGPRAGHAMTYDPTRGVIILYGGNNGNTTGALGDTWEFDETSWVQRANGNGADGLVGARMMFAPDRAKALRFSGTGAYGLTNSVFEWEGTSWMDTPLPGPRFRFDHALAYDSARQRVVLFGGNAGSGYAGDTWEWDGTAWTLRATLGPAPRGQSAMTYDSARANTILFGGWNLGTSPNPPIYYGDTWLWNGASWTQSNVAGPAARKGHTLVFDSQRSRAVLVGGVATSTYFGDTWEWDGMSWSQRASSGITPRSYHAAAYDSARMQTVVFGGTNSSNFFGLQDTLLWDGTTWTAPTVAAPPDRRYYSTMAFDPIRSRVVLFGGHQQASMNDTWEWDGATWTQRASTGPLPRQQAAMVFDALGQRILLYGGTDSSVDLFEDTWAYFTRGGSCSMASDCETGFCVDGVCCEQASCGPCRACDTAASPGLCAPVPNGTACATGICQSGACSGVDASVPDAAIGDAGMIADARGGGDAVAADAATSDASAGTDAAGSGGIGGSGPGGTNGGVGGGGSGGAPNMGDTSGCSVESRGDTGSGDLVLLTAFAIWRRRRRLTSDRILC